METLLFVTDIGEKEIKPRSRVAESTPYYSLSITDQIFAANQASFDSPEFFGEGSRVYIMGDHHPFGGTIQKRVEKNGYYSYECIDFTRVLFGTIGYSSYNRYCSDIVKYILNAEGLPVSGVEQSTIKYPHLLWNWVKGIDLIQQCAQLDGKEFFINADGIPIYRTPPSTIEGWVFYPESSISDYELSNDVSDIITHVQVFGADDTFLYTISDDNLVGQYGDIIDVIRDSNITTTNAAKQRGDDEFFDKGRVDFSGNVVLPTILNVGSAEWCAFAPPAWSKGEMTPYYIQSVKTDIDSSTRAQTISLLSGKPTPPSEWQYTDPNGNVITVSSSKTCTQKPGVDAVCGTMKPSCTYCVINKVPYRDFTKCWVNKCPFCGGKLLKNPKKAPEGEWTCASCGADFCGVCGHEKRYPARKILTAATSGGGTVCKTTTTTKTSSSSIPKSSGVNSLRTPAAVRAWVDAHIAYKFYWDFKYTPQQVLNQGYGNCADQARLCLTLITALGYKCQLIHTKCNGIGHYNIKVLINGRWLTCDTTCHKLNQI